MEWIEDTSSQLVGLHLKSMPPWLAVFSQQSLAIPPGPGRAQMLKHQKNRKKKRKKKHNVVCVYMNVYVHTHMHIHRHTHSFCVFHAFVWGEGRVHVLLHSRPCFG